MYIVVYNVALSGTVSSPPAFCEGLNNATNEKFECELKEHNSVICLFIFWGVQPIKCNITYLVKI